MIDVPILVRDALKDGGYHKEYKFYVLNNDGTTDFVIDNDNLVSESVKIDERLCSADTIKFGLCEGSSLEFEYFGLANIKGRQLKATLTAEYDNAGTIATEEIPMGFFTVDTVSRQASTGILRVTAYNKLKSKYLDAKANESIKEMYSNPDIPVHVIDIENLLLNEYGIREEQRERVPISALRRNTETFPINVAIKTTARYGVDTLLSYFNLGSVNNYLWMKSESPHYVLDPNQPYKIGFNKDFEVYEERVYDKLYELFDGAQLDKDASTIMNAFMNSHTAGGYTYDGFQNVIGIKLTKQDNSIEYYSTIGYRNGCSGVVGTWKDLSQKTLYGYKDISVYLPNGMWISSSSSNPDQSLVNAFYYFWGPRRDFYYYADSALEDLATGYYTPVKYSDGSTIPYTDLETAEQFYVDKITNLTDAELVEIIPSTMPDVTLRELQSAVYETLCQFGQLSRETDLFSGVELNRSRLLPADTLYPDNALYPGGATESAFKSQYSKLWADEGNIHKWKYLIVTFKGLDENMNEKDFTLQRTVNANGTDNYNMSDNWLFRNFVWTAEQVGEYADAMVEKMQNITWFPFEMWAVGLPYLETGDEIEIPLNEETYVSYILQRQLKGIQNLQDTYINGELDIF